MTRLFRFPLRRLLTAVAVTGLLMVPLAMFGGPALAHTASALHQYGQPGSAQYQYGVTVCHHIGWRKHRWHVITIRSRALAAHLRHGDQLPPCRTTDIKHHGKPAHSASHDQSSLRSKHDEDDDHGHGHHGKGHHGRR